MSNKSNAKPIQSVNRALQLFEVFRTADQEEFGITELSNALGLHKNNVFRLLATLSSCGYIEQNPETENYRLGIGIFNLGQKFIHKLGILKLSRPFMQKITSEVNESTYIGIIRDGNATYLGISETSLPVRVASRVGKDVPAYATAIGKIHLAYASDEELARMYPENKLHKYTSNTILTLADLKRHLKEAAANEYVIDNEELEVGVKCVAVPIKDYLGMLPVAAISVSGPVSRMSDERIKLEILPVMQKFSREISKRLGYQQ
jgi:DNA-binding IclR family transcriptional regulator